MLFDRNPSDKSGISGLYRGSVVQQTNFKTVKEQGVASSETNTELSPLKMKRSKSRKRLASPMRGLVHGKKRKLSVRRPKKIKKKTYKKRQNKVSTKNRRKKSKDRF